MGKARKLIPITTPYQKPKPPLGITSYQVLSYWPDQGTITLRFPDGVKQETIVDTLNHIHKQEELAKKHNITFHPDEDTDGESLGSQDSEEEEEVEEEEEEEDDFIEKDKE